MPKNSRGKKNSRNPQHMLKSADVFEFSKEFMFFYKDLLIPNHFSEEEFNNMLEIYKTSLPTVFRLSTQCDSTEKLQKEVGKFIEEFKSKGIDCGEINYIPNDIGKIYYFDIEKKELRDKCREFKTWLNLHCDLGECHRQEFVSMVPPFFLDVNKKSSVLDTCASPGSKTAQIVEMLDEDGMIVANDILDERRLKPLVSNLQRVGTKNVMVTAHNGQSLPDFGIQFDRVLCDVPCTCDGTIRKNEIAGSKWDIRGCANQHSLQKLILKRGLELLKVGGLCVYSTCSMSPYENEAVISSVINEIGSNKIEIVDVSQLYPDLKRSKGIKSWSVYSYEADNDEFIRYEKFEDVPKGKTGYVASLFPTNVPDSIENCMRFYPQYQNSGGFFVAVLKKLDDFGGTSKDPPKNEKEWKQDEYYPLSDVSPKTIEMIKSTFGLRDDFPFDTLFVRGNRNQETEIVRKIYKTNKTISKVAREKGCSNLRIYTMGDRFIALKPLGKNKLESPYFCEEMIDVAVNHVHSKLVNAKPEDILRLLYASPKGVKYDALATETANQMKREVSGVIIRVENTSFVFSGVTFEASVTLFAKKEFIKNWIDILLLKYPELESLNNTLKPAVDARESLLSLIKKYRDQNREGKTSDKEAVTNLLNKTQAWVDGNYSSSIDEYNKRTDILNNEFTKYLKENKGE